MAGNLRCRFRENVIRNVVLLVEEVEQLLVHFLDSCILTKKTRQLNQLSQNVVGLSVASTTLQLFFQTFEDSAQNLGQFLQSDLGLWSIYHDSQVNEQYPVYYHVVMVRLLLNERYLQQES